MLVHRIRPCPSLSPLPLEPHLFRPFRPYLPPCHASSSSLSSNGTQSPEPAKKDKPPLQQQILNGVLSVSNIPYSSFVPSPETFLHKVDARIKQLWLVAIYLVIARSSPPVRAGVAIAVALASILVLPKRLWTTQLQRLGILSAILMVTTALFSDGVPPVLQPRDPPPLIDELPPIPPTDYSYVVLHVWLVTVTRRSLNLALTAGALTFCALQTSSLCLVTTPGEEMAVALRWWLSPLKWLGVPTHEVALTLLLSLRFMSLVFEEVRNLALGLAARGIDWVAHGRAGSLHILGRLSSRLFGNLFRRSENIAQAMVARGFVGPEDHVVYMTNINKTSLISNVVAIALLALFVGSARDFV